MLLSPSDNRSVNSIQYDDHPIDARSHNFKRSSVCVNSQSPDLNRLYDASQTDLEMVKHVRKKRRDPFDTRDQSISTKIQKTVENYDPRRENVEPVSLIVKQEPVAENEVEDTESDSGTIGSQVLDQTKGVSDQGIADSDSGLEYREGIPGQLHGE